MLPVQRALEDEGTLVVIDNLESVLPPPYLPQDDALAADARANLDAILALCRRLGGMGPTRLVLTSREPLPEPFVGHENYLELSRLAEDDAVRLVERALGREHGTGAVGDATREAIDELVEAVQGHARTLALLGPSLGELGVERTRQSLAALLVEMDRRFPGSRERSLFASVELSLRRLSPENRQRAQVLGVFHGEVDLNVLRVMMKWEKEDVASLGRELIDTGLAVASPYAHLRLDPALCPYLGAGLAAAERVALEARWSEAMRAFVEFLYEQQSQDAQIASTLTLLELPNLMALLDGVQTAGDAEATVDLCMSLFLLLQNVGKPRLLERVGAVRDAAAKALGEDWSHARFESQRMRVEQLLDAGRRPEAFSGARDLHQRAAAAGESAYPDADYDIAMACIVLAQALEMGGAAQQALPLLEDAQTRFEAVEQRRPGCGAEKMASVSLTGQGDCLRDLGQLDRAAAAYEEAIRRGEKRKGTRSIATNRFQLGSVRLLQRRYADALAAYEEARKTFTALDEPGSVATAWHQIGIVREKAGQPEAAEKAYRESLAARVRLGDVAGQAASLNQLGRLYERTGRPEDAVAFYRQAADKCVRLEDQAKEGFARGNLADCLRQLKRYTEAREEIRRAIACFEQFGHAAQPWKAWAILGDIELADAHPEAAAQARKQAMELFLAYRRDGGENHDDGARLCAALAAALREGNTEAVAQRIAALRNTPGLPDYWPPLLSALEAILAGRRDPALAADPALYYRDAVEIRLLLESLPPAGEK